MDVNETQLTIIYLDHTRQWWKSLNFPVVPGIHMKIATSSQQFFIKVEKVASLSRDVIINSCQGRGRDSAVMPLWVFVCSNLKLQTSTSQEPAELPLSWELKGNLCYVSSAILKWTHLYLSWDLSSEHQKSSQTTTTNFLHSFFFFFFWYPTFFSVCSLLYLVIQSLS